MVELKFRADIVECSYEVETDTEGVERTGLIVIVHLSYAELLWLRKTVHELIGK